MRAVLVKQDAYQDFYVCHNRSRSAAVPELSIMKGGSMGLFTLFDAESVDRYAYDVAI